MGSGAKSAKILFHKTEFADSEQSSAFKLDGLRSSHPIEVEVKGPEEVDEIFDTISYAKGASIINMLYHFIGDEAFFNGLKSYIAKFQYSNAYTEDLWDAFSSASGKPIRDIMSNWTRTMGYPVVSVKTENSSADGVDVVLSQSRFLSDGTIEEGLQSKWAVPVTICEADDNSKVLGKVLMPVDGKPVSVHLDRNVPFRLNPGRVSFYRVMYDNSLLSGIMEAVKNGKVGPRDRIALIDDQFSIAFSGKQSLHSALEFLKAFAGEPHHVVWSNLAVILRHVRLLIEEISFRNLENSGKVPDIMEKSDPERSLDKLYQLLASPVFEKIGWSQENESYNDIMLRPIILSVLAKSDYAPVIEEANIRFQKHYEHIMKSKGDSSKEQDVISPDIRTTVYGCAMRNNGEAVYKQLLNLYEAASMQDERVRILASLGVAKQSELRARTLQYAVSPEVRKQDRFRCLISVNGSGPLGRRALWEFVQNRIELLPEDLGSQALLSYVLKSACCDFISKTKYREIKEFFDKHPVPCKRAIDQSLESVSINASQVERDAAGILKFLASL